MFKKYLVLILALGANQGFAAQADKKSWDLETKLAFAGIGCANSFISIGGRISRKLGPVTNRNRSLKLATIVSDAIICGTLSTAIAKDFSKKNYCYTQFYLTGLATVPGTAIIISSAVGLPVAGSSICGGIGAFITEDTGIAIGITIGGILGAKIGFKIGLPIAHATLGLFNKAWKNLTKAEDLE
jgi:hypothetical protein